MAAALHLVAATLRDDAPAEAVEHAVAMARGLEAAPGVEAVLVGTSEGRLVVATWLEGLAALEAFAESREHMAFVMRGLAPAIRGMWSAAVEPSNASTPLPPPDAAALWVFALPEAEGVYEWQVRELLDAVLALPGTAVAGPTVEERERYRASGLVCTTIADAGAFESALTPAREAWTQLLGSLEEARVEVLRA